MRFKMKPFSRSHLSSASRIHLSFFILTLLLATATLCATQSISIPPADFDRLIMPCYLGQSSFGGGGGGGGGYYMSPSTSYQQQQQSVPVPTSVSSQLLGTNQQAYGPQPSGGGFGRASKSSNPNGSPGYYGAASGATGGDTGASGASGPNRLTPPLPYPAPAPAYGPLPGQAGETISNNGYMGQQIPRANTIDSFISLVSKIESANPRLAQNVDELIRVLLGRFRMDNYYYDARSRVPISTESSRKNDYILAAILSPSSSSALAGGSSLDVSASGYSSGGRNPQQAYSLVDQTLDHSERCSMYFMLSHFIEKSSAMPTLGQLPLSQLAGPQVGQRSPSLQSQSMGSSANGMPGSSSSYPAQSAQMAYTSGSSGPRYSGPSPSFGATVGSGQMNQFGSGISNSQPESTGKNSYGVNQPLPTGPFGPSQYNAMTMMNSRNGQFGNSNLASTRYSPGLPPYIDGQSSSRTPDDRVATEYGVVTLPGQNNAALVLNRVLLGLLAASTPPQTVRQLASQVYPSQALLNMMTPKLDESLDPLFAVSLADLWASSSMKKAGRAFDIRMMGDNGSWNDTFCPTKFTLERANSIKFTTAELLGGLDGFNLGQLRRTLMAMRRNIKLSELLRMYYSPTGFRPQFQTGVCTRYATMNSYQDELKNQAEIYARLYQLDLATSDNNIAISISQLDIFREMIRQAAEQYQPVSICQDSAGISTELYPLGNQDSCEISRADVVAVLDSSVQANNEPFMQLTVTKLAQRLNLAARGGSSLSVMTNQLDTTGTAGGGLSFNTILRNSTNLAEIGCGLMYDSTRTFQGGQITDPTKLMELFELALINLDSEYLTRQRISNSYASDSSSSSRPSTYVSTWYGNGMDSMSGANYLLMSGGSGGPRNTGGSKVILWFNYGNNGIRPSSASSGPTNWTPGQTYMSSSTSRNEENEYRFHEAKRNLKENFRGASILAISPNKNSVKTFVYDEERDIFTDIPNGGNSMGSDGGSGDGYSPSSGYMGAQMDLSMYSGQAEQLIGKLLARMCTIPALFQYPMCFLGPSDGAQSVGYITPGRKQYWMMAPKTFFSSRSIRMAFRVEGGRIRVCFGRKPNPDETSLKNRDQQQQMFQTQAIAFTSNGQQPNGQPQPTQAPPKASDDDYYTGMEYGICKDVSPNQEIDFFVSDACYKRSISECEPFYFVIREISMPGEGDPNYMCRDDGCKRFDQVKFIMTHTGVVCSSAISKLSSPSWMTILISMLVTYYTTFNFQPSNIVTKTKSNRMFIDKSIRCPYLCLSAVIVFALCFTQQVSGQLLGGVYDFGQGRYGEKRGNFTPSEWVAIVLIFMLILGGLAITIALCYYVTKKSRQGMSRVPQDGY